MIVHTHSPFAMVFVILGLPIPVYLTARVDEFSCAIQCGGYSPTGNDEIGRVLVESVSLSPAALLNNHGVFMFGLMEAAVVKVAMMVADFARTAGYMLQIGRPEQIPPEMVERLLQRYAHVYRRDKRDEGNLPGQCE